ncbi:MAG TPA: tryptophan synthase subunit alpha [Pseudogracilibacillus sp.]|nr:tryptophan synthase subunit alpha [Pseudogracilibacillus sp.]
MGMKQIENYFRSVQNKGARLFVPYIVAGDGGLDVLHERIKLLEESGVAAIELGIPFSDPVADGPTIQQASERALQNGTTLRNVLEVLRAHKAERNVPIILMTYVNPIYAYGIETFAHDCATAGVSGLIIPDVPMEEESLLADAFAMNELAFIRLAALTSPEERLRDIAAKTEGFLYAVSVTGTTGERHTYEERVYSYLQTLKTYSDVPVLAGFGISHPEQAKTFGNYCDGVIVGSKIVDLFHAGKDADVTKFVKESIF